MQYTSREVYEFISKQTNDPIIEWKTCAVSWTEFPIYQSDLDFYMKISPTFSGQKFQIPIPTLCPEERSKRRLCRRNESKLYRRSDIGSIGLSIYSPDKPYNVVSPEYRWSDQRNPFDYGFDFDETKGVFTQIEQLILRVPTIALNVMGNENCDYVNCCGYSKNCYLSYNTDYSENMLYSSNCLKCTDSVDLYQCQDCVLCYNSIDLHNCYRVRYSQSCSDCKDSYFLSDCQNCNDCYGCVNLVNVQYHIFNRSYSKEEYMLKLEQLQKKNYETQYHEFWEFSQTQACKYYYWGTADGCIGNYITHDSNVVYGFDTHKSEHTKYTWVLDSVQHCQDRDHTGYDGAWSYQLSSCGDKIYNTAFSINIWSGSDRVYYCILCIGVKNCFGCVWLRNKQYCIFNKQYESKEKYEEQVSKIIQHMMTTGEWWEFFPAALSPFGYNETLAQEYYPLSEWWVAKQWFSRSHYSRDPQIPADAMVIDCGRDVIPLVDEISSDIVANYIFVCKESSRPYKLIVQEIQFYKKHQLPIPLLHPDIRHLQRVKSRQWRSLYLRECDKCTKELVSVYPQNYSWIIYCEQCYQKEIFA